MSQPKILVVNAAVEFGSLVTCMIAERFKKESLWATNLTMALALADDSDIKVVGIEGAITHIDEVVDFIEKMVAGGKVVIAFTDHEVHGDLMMSAGCDRVHEAECPASHWAVALVDTLHNVERAARKKATQAAT